MYCTRTCLIWQGGEILKFTRILQISYHVYFNTVLQQQLLQPPCEITSIRWYIRWKSIKSTNSILLDALYHRILDIWWELSWKISKSTWSKCNRITWSTSYWLLDVKNSESLNSLSLLMVSGQGRIKIEQEYYLQAWLNQLFYNYLFFVKDETIIWLHLSNL